MFNNAVVTGGTFYHHTTQNINNGTPNNRALDILTNAASPNAFHNSGSRYDPPKCHENTRVAVLEKLKGWAIGADSDTRNKWIMWMYGGAGAGKSAIGQTFAEKCDSEGRLLGSFFFGRSDATRNQAKFLVPTIACQVYKQVSEARDKMVFAIDNDPMIFNNTLLMQFESLVIHPLMSLQDTATRNIIIIDGLDECVDRSSQSSILRALFDVVQRPNCHIRFLLASRPEHEIVTAFSLQADAVFARLMLDDEYGTYDDIRLFLNDRIRLIKDTHPFRHLIPREWPEDEAVDDIVKKSSGQFIYVSTAVNFIESIRHRPHERMDVVRNLRPPNGAMPFAELDALYTHILKSAQDVSTIVELLSFVLYVSQLGFLTGVRAECFEELLDLEPGSLALILCDVGALVVIDKYDTVRVLHASLLDFLIDPSRSKDLPISGDVLIMKHITSCFRYLSRNKISGGTDPLIEFIDGTNIALSFLARYLDRIPVFTADMADALDGFSLFKLCQPKEVPLFIKYSFLKLVNPLILQLLQQSDQHEFLSRYLTMMDKSFLALMDEYPPYTLVLQISIMIHDNVFPRSALNVSFQLPKFHANDEKLALIPFLGSPRDLGPTQSQRSILCEFLLDPSRSQHHNFLRSGPKLYDIALLGCFDYLNKVVIQQDCLIDETWVDKEASSMIDLDEVTLVNQGANEAPENECAKTIPGSPQEYATTDTKNDLKTWQQGWKDNFPDVQTMDGVTDDDLVTLKQKSHHLYEYHTIKQGRYYLMLGYMIYFFPRAGFSQELIKVSKTTVLHQDRRLFPEQTAAAQHAMGAYLQRMAENLAVKQNNADENTDTILLYPSTSYNTPLKDVTHRSTEILDNRQELDKTITTVSDGASDVANSPQTASTTAISPETSSIPMILSTNQDVDLSALSSPPTSGIVVPPAGNPNEAGNKAKKPKMNFLSRWWRARKRT